MFDSATRRLTFIYLSILCVICLIFNVVIYRLVVSEYQRSQLNQNNFFDQRPQFRLFINDPEARAFRDRQFTAAKKRVQLELLLIDLGLLSVGGFISYLLARRTLQPIEAAHDAQSRFAADASHELRTPIATMQTEIEVALRDKKLNLKDSKQLLKSNLAELATLRELTAGLLTLARDDSATVLLTKQPVKPTLDLAVAQLQTAITNKSISLHIESEKETRAITSQLQLKELLIILLDNAVKYSPSNTSILIKVESMKDHLQLSIQDQGIGMSSEELAQIFDRFYRADSARSKSNQPGHGLGLAIAKQLAQQINAQLRLESRPNTGTTAHLLLPR